jgi:hypothetical protein
MATALATQILFTTICSYELFYEKYSTIQSYLWFWPPLILGGSVISACTIHDLRRVKVPAVNRYVFAPISFHPFVKLGPEQSWHHFKIKKWPITNYVQTQFSVISSNISMITLQCNSYLSHVRSFFKISSNFLSLISSYPHLKMFFSTLSFLWTTAVGPRQNNYVQTQFSVISSNISMIIMYYEYMTTQYFGRFFLSI